MSLPPPPLSPEREAQAQELVVRLRPQAEQELLALARFLVRKPEHAIFGDTEFEARTIVPRLGAHAFATHLAEKKTATKARASSVPTANQGPKSKATAPKQPLV